MPYVNVKYVKQHVNQEQKDSLINGLMDQVLYEQRLLIFIMAFLIIEHFIHWTEMSLQTCHVKILMMTHSFHIAGTTHPQE